MEETIRSVNQNNSMLITGINDRLIVGASGRRSYEVHTALFKSKKNYLSI